MVLIIGSAMDPHVQAIIEHLSISSTEYAILDRYDWESSHGLELEIDKTISLCLGRPKAQVRVSAIWWRQKPKSLQSSSSVSDYYDRVFVDQEWNHVLRYLEHGYSDALSINDPTKALLAGNKLYQLKLATSLGVKIPQTIFTNNPYSVLKLIESSKPGKVVFKTLNAYMSPIGLLTYTSIIDKQMVVDGKASIKRAPGIYQTFVQKEYELRITIVGTEVYAARVENDEVLGETIDWREHHASNKWMHVQISEEFKHQLLKLHKAFGLFYGAYDFIRDEKGDYVFMEVNPSGQWLWLEKCLGFPISNAIANKLMRNF